MGKPNCVENLSKRRSIKVFDVWKTCGKPVDKMLKSFPSIVSFDSI
jgi:hypothetical protein